MDYNDAGTYTCRARVMETGSLEERDIKLEVCWKLLSFGKETFLNRNKRNENQLSYCQE